MQSFTVKIFQFSQNELTETDRQRWFYHKKNCYNYQKITHLLVAWKQTAGNWVWAYYYDCQKRSKGSNWVLSLKKDEGEREWSAISRSRYTCNITKSSDLIRACNLSISSKTKHSKHSEEYDWFSYRKNAKEKCTLKLI